MAPYRPHVQEIEKLIDTFYHNIKHRQKMARQYGQRVMRAAKVNIRKERTVTGSPMAPRKQQRADRRLLQGLAIPENKDFRMVVKSRASQGGGVSVTYNDRMTAEIAAKHQFGLGNTHTAESVAKERGSPDYNKPCTRAQAEALITIGYRLMVPRKGGGRRPKRVSVLWLQKHFSLGHAGLVLRIMRTGSARGSVSWRRAPAARPFLGVTAKQVSKWNKRIMKQILKKKIS